MIDKNKLVNLCLLNSDAVETYPFKNKNYEEYAVIRHKSNGKWFALVFFLEGTLYVNLKVKPFEAVILKDQYPEVSSAWHMNKTHWIKVEAAKAPVDLLKRLIKISFELTL